MSLRIELVAETFDEMKAEIAKLVIAFGMSGFNEAPAKPEKQKATKSPAKEAKKVEESPAPKSDASLDTATELLKKVNETKGLPVARSVLTAVGVNRMSEVPPEKYGEVIAACEKLLA